MTGRIHSYHTLSAIDGPGLRFVLFMQGCRLRCQYCHNPDSWQIDAGKEYTAEEVFDIIQQYKEFISGGVTVSGGEPLLQQDFLCELFALLHNAGYHTAIDTAGSVDYFADNDKLLNVTDLVILDIKHADCSKYKSLTTGELKVTLENAKKLSDFGKEMWIRYVLVPNLTDDLNDVYKLRQILDEYKTVSKIIVQPYTTLGVKKWEALNIEYKLKETVPPTKEVVKKVEEILTKDYRYYK